MTEDREYHIGIAPGEIPELVLLPGDPHRAEDIAVRFFDEYDEVAKSREYWSFKGKWKGVPVASCSTGIGCPSAAIALEELVKVGCNTFLRVGTSGAISHSVNNGDLVIFTGSVRDDGTSRQYVPVEYPAVANPEMVMALIKSAKNNGVRFHVGIGHTKDAFYSEHPNLVADSANMRKKWGQLRDLGVLATEMEAASLFIVGQLRGVRVGTICLVVGENVEKEVKITSKPPIDELITVALDAIISLKQ